MMDQKLKLIQTVSETLVSAVEKKIGEIHKSLREELSAQATVLNAKAEEISKIPGPQGEKGEKGDPGESIKGEKGDPGESIKGDKGDPGPMGLPGESVKGDKGDPGEKGDKGDPGEKGEPGEKGAPGESIKGDKGDPGPMGLPGESIKGDPGEKGDKGDPGESIKGEKGDPGPMGLPGESIKGDKGDPGESIRGEKGEKGDPGEKGDKGDPGLNIKGDPGESIKGEKGDKGDKGDPVSFEEVIPVLRSYWEEFSKDATAQIESLGAGLSIQAKDQLVSLVDEYAANIKRLEQELKDTTLAHLETVKSIKGDKGDPGESIKGDKGDPGESIKGEKGERGLPGIKGDPGVKGDPGQDAMEMDIVENLRKEKSYPRGTWARYKGGLIRARRDTDSFEEGSNIGDAGWTVIVNGIAEQDISLDERTLTIVTRMTSGEVRKTHKLPVLLDKGLYESGAVYEKGDVVSRGGSMWIAQTDTSSQPGVDESWRLSVKHGRDGSNGKDGVLKPAVEPSKPISLK